MACVSAFVKVEQRMTSVCCTKHLLPPADNGSVKVSIVGNAGRPPTRMHRHSLFVCFLWSDATGYSKSQLNQGGGN